YRTHRTRLLTVVVFTFLVRYPANTRRSTPSLHDALPIFAPDRIDRNRVRRRLPQGSSLEVLEADLDADGFARRRQVRQPDGDEQDRKSTRLNSSHVKISYAVFCLKKKMLTTSPNIIPPHA